MEEPESTDLAKFFAGLSREQVRLIQQSQSYWMRHKGDAIFRQWDRANSLFVVLSGKVEVYRRTMFELVPVVELGPGSVFGEMGILIESCQRTAFARALETTLLLEIPNPIELSHRIGDPQATLQVLKKLICLLAKRLSHRDQFGPDSKFIEARPLRGFGQKPTEALETVAQSLPRDAAGVLKKQATLQPGEHLVRMGEPSDCFYFIHAGRLEVIKEPGQERGAMARTVTAPATAGEVGFFSGRPRSAGLRAMDEVTYTEFSGAEYDALLKTKPRQAIEVLFAAARLTVYLILNR